MIIRILPEVTLRGGHRTIAEGTPYPKNGRIYIDTGRQAPVGDSAFPPQTQKNAKKTGYL